MDPGGEDRPIAATLETGSSVSEIAHSAGIQVSQIFRWREEFCQISAPPVAQRLSQGAGQFTFAGAGCWQ
ncbi:transposase [Ensifer adhaerens]|uniref:transposase n=1 Tax=Ensifer adhaerens TaxID=106592 RepID=UPI0039999A70